MHDLLKGFFHILIYVYNMLRVFCFLLSKSSFWKKRGREAREGGRDGREAEYGERRVRERMKEGRNKQRDREW